MFGYLLHEIPENPRMDDDVVPLSMLHIIYTLYDMVCSADLAKMQLYPP